MQQRDGIKSHHQAAAESKRQNHGQPFLPAQEDSFPPPSPAATLPPSGGWILVLFCNPYHPHLQQVPGERWLHGCELCAPLLCNAARKEGSTPSSMP